MTKHITEELLKTIIRKNPDSEQSFYVVDLKKVYDCYKAMQTELPRVTPHYAIKCNSDPVLLKFLSLLDFHYDCASYGEIDIIRDLGVQDLNSHIIFAQPCKMPSHIKHAKDLGIKRMTFDSPEELRKVHALYPDAELVLRICIDDKKSTHNFAKKFGLHVDRVPEVLGVAAQLRANIIGVSFHVGTDCQNFGSYESYILAAEKVFQQARDFGYELTLLDIGGGFPTAARPYDVMKEVGSIVNPLLDRFSEKTTFICEPGRYIPSTAYTIAVNVYCRKMTYKDNDEALGIPLKGTYYVNDGLYQSFNYIYFDPRVKDPNLLVFDEDHKKDVMERPVVPCTIFGPSCDSIDVIFENYDRLPVVKEGEWLYFEEMGAYTVSCQTDFNGLKGAYASRHYVWGDKFIDMDNFVEDVKKKIAEEEGK